MTKKLNYQSTFDDVGWSLRETLDEIKQHGENKQLKFDMLLKYGRIKLMEGKPSEAYQIFQQCSVHAIDNGISEVKELYYWTSRCQEEQGNKDRALTGYLMSLERNGFIENDEEFVNAVLDRLILFGDISSLVNEYKKQRDEEMNNPKDLLGKVIKFLKEAKEIK
jgi:tetratricopeptide (TPR) repeat protein